MTREGVPGKIKCRVWRLHEARRRKRPEMSAADDSTSGENRVLQLPLEWHTCTFGSRSHLCASLEMNRLVLVITLLPLTAGELLACPGCTYERMLLSNWLPKVIALKVSAAVLITAWRLDPLRVFYTFLGYVFIYDFLYRLAISLAFPGGAPVLSALGTAGMVVLTVGILDISLLFLLGRINFYRRRKDLGLAWWHPAAYLLCTWTAWAMIS